VLPGLSLRKVGFGTVAMGISNEVKSGWRVGGFDSKKSWNGRKWCDP